MSDHASSPPPAKKARQFVQDEEGIANKDRDYALKNFKKNQKLVAEVHAAAVIIDHGFSDLIANSLKIDLTDASKENSFSRAMCYTTAYTEMSPIAIGALFRTGMEVLYNFITATDQDCLPDDESSKEALKKLFTLLSEELPEELFNREGYSECQWAVILAQHLLSKLSLQSNYTIDDHYQGKTSMLKKDGKYCCACPEKDLMVGRFGDTSYGCPTGWHGSVDILFEDSLPTRVIGKGTGSDDADEEDDDDRCSVLSHSSGSSIEVESSKHFSDHDGMQIKSQCIAFSFLQKKRDPTMKNNLTPAVGICKRKVKVLFYDCDNDILLTSEELNFTASAKTFDYAVIMLLWLTLNYKMFCTGVPDNIKQLKANFHESAGEKLNSYRDDVRYKLSMKKTEQFEPTFRKGINLNPVFPPYI